VECLTDLCAGRALVPGAGSRRVEGPIRDPIALAAGVLRSAVKANRGAEPGTRNNTLFSYAVWVAEYVGRGWLGASDARAQLAEAARACGLGDDEIEGTLSSAFNRGVASLPRLPEPARPPDPPYAEDGPVPGVRADDPLPPADHHWVIEKLTREQCGDAELLYGLYRDRVLYDPGDKNWYVWNGTAYVPDRTQLVKRLVTGQVAAQYLQVLSCLNVLAASGPSSRQTRAGKMPAVPELGPSREYPG
jgi:hypothetical protein